jgi:hypothetical protein
VTQEHLRSSLVQCTASPHELAPAPAPRCMQVHRRILKQWEDLKAAKAGSIKNRIYRLTAFNLYVLWIDSATYTCVASWAGGRRDHGPILACRFAQGIIDREDVSETFLKSLPSATDRYDVLYPVST